MKSRTLLKAGVLSACLAAYPMAASAVLIDFQGLADGTIVTNQFAEATFSAGADEIQVTNQPIYAGTGGLFICTAASGGTIDCLRDFTVTFTSPVSNLTFDSVGDNQGRGDVGAKVDVFVDGLLAATVDIIGDGITENTDPVDLTAFSNVTALRFHSNVDPAGLGYDNFSFDVAAVPEPSALLLLGAGLMGWLGTARRRK